MQPARITASALLSMPPERELGFALAAWVASATERWSLAM